LQYSPVFKYYLNNQIPVLVFRYLLRVFKYWKIFRYRLVKQKQPSCIKHLLTPSASVTLSECLSVL